MALCGKCGSEKVPPLGADVVVTCAGCERQEAEARGPALVLNAHKNVRRLSGHVQKWGLVLGSMSEREAFAYLQETERKIAGVRAAIGGGA